VPLWIKDPAALQAHLAVRPSRVGLDTEFIRERTYWPQLALVQIVIGGAADDRTASAPPAIDRPDPDGADVDGVDVDGVYADGTGAHGVILLVDPLAPGMAAALVPMLTDPSILKIMHSASEDLVAFKHACGVVPQPLFDTQQAAALAGIGAGLGYQKLVEQLTGVALTKGETRSDWLRRPLSPSQLDYAADDVRHLFAMHDALDGMLGQLGRREWLAEDALRTVFNAENEAPERWPHLSIRSAQILGRDAQRRLLRLLRWRDVYARDTDRPRTWILDNEFAVGLARHVPADPDALQARLDAHPKAPRKLGNTIWQVLATPLPDEGDAPDASVAEARDKNRLRLLQEAVAKRSGELGLPDGVLASRRWLEALLDHGDWPDALSGWRRAALEPALAPLLATPD